MSFKAGALLVGKNRDYYCSNFYIVIKQCSEKAFDTQAYSLYDGEMIHECCAFIEEDFELLKNETTISTA